MTELSEKIMINTIKRLKKEKNALILAHNYQIMEVQDVADFVGDSLELAQKASQTDAKMIVFCGVKFMAETAKLLKPNAKVLLSQNEAGCPMADMITSKQLEEFKKEHPQSTVLCYVNSSVEVKAESDICCTSSNAVKIIESLPKDNTILFVPDQNLGTFAAQKTNKNVIVWKGFCRVHHSFISVQDIENARENFPDYKIIVHPECSPEVFNLADIVGSTKQIADYIAENDKVIIGTEIGLIAQLRIKYPNKKIRSLSDKAICINMKKTSLRDVFLTLLEENNEIIIEEKIAKKALKSINRMLQLS